MKYTFLTLFTLFWWGILRAQHHCDVHGCGAEGLKGLHIDANTFTPPPSMFSSGAPRASDFIVNYIGFPAEAQSAFAYAVEIWSSVISSPVAIRIDATWEPLASGALAQAGPNQLHQNFQGAAFANTYYASALANSLNNDDLSPQSDITCSINSEADWYFGTDGQTPSGHFDLVTAALHEIGHGLGFIGSAFYQNGYGFIGTAGVPYVYDAFVQTADTTAIQDLPNGSLPLGDALTSDGLFWGGPEAIELPGNSLPRLYAPPSYELGVSYSHLNEFSYPAGSSNSLMTPTLNTAEAQHDPGPIMLAMLRDMGWSAEYCMFLSVSNLAQTECDPETNLFNQTLLIEWQGAPESGLLLLNDDAFFLGTSPREITLSGLQANGDPHDVTLAFSALPSCQSEFPAAFTAPSQCFCLTDLSGNGVTDVTDVLEMLMGFGCTADCNQGDANGDGAVNVQDALDILAAYGQSCN